MGGGEASAALCGANLKEEMTVRKFTTDQYAASGLQMHPYMTPAETHPAFTCAHKVLSCVLAAALVVKKQPDGKLTVVMTAKDGSKVEIADNDHVLMAT
eukprot:scaffold312009_cov18-Tisochrysis_lutea.AAC.1